MYWDSGTLAHGAGVKLSANLDDFPHYVKGFESKYEIPLHNGESDNYTENVINFKNGKIKLQCHASYYSRNPIYTMLFRADNKTDNILGSFFFSTEPPNIYLFKTYLARVIDKPDMLVLVSIYIYSSYIPASQNMLQIYKRVSEQFKITDLVGEDGIIDNTYPEDSDLGGGDGDKDLTSDTIDLPDLPSVTGLTSNFITAYAPSNAQLNQLANFMWTSDFLDNFKKLWSNPMENLISLAIMPFNVNTSGSGTVVIGYWLTDVTMPKITQQFQEIDCGSLKIGKFYNSFLDYGPYTKISIYLPFIGIRQLKVDEIMGKTLSVKYRVDIISGTCVAYILVNNSIFYQFNGNCATTIPITNADYSNLINASLQSTSGVLTMSAGIMGGASIVAGAGASMLAGGMIDTVTSMKPDINKSGNMSGSSGMMGVKTPFLMKEIPRQSWAKDNNKFKGIPSNVLSKLSALKGYTEVDKIKLSDINATEKEMIEIENLLKQGVIL